jgi:hypothetical protein
MDDARQRRIDEILAAIDAEADAGWSSNWAEIDERRTALVVTLADGSKRRYALPPA